MNNNTLTFNKGSYSNHVLKLNHDYQNIDKRYMIQNIFMKVV